MNAWKSFCTLLWVELGVVQQEKWLTSAALSSLGSKCFSTSRQQ